MPRALCSAFSAFRSPLLNKFLGGVFVAALVLGAFSMAWQTASAQTFTVGSTAQVVTDDGGNLNLRAAPSLSAAIITSLPDRSFVTIRDGSQQAEGLTWQFVEAAGSFGWVAALYLQPVQSSPEPTPSPMPSPTPTPSPTPAPSAPVPPSVAGGSIVGPLPTTGRPSLVVWGGGGPDAIAAAAAGRGCALRSVWATADGRLIGYQFGVPTFVNAGWTSRFGATLPGTTAIMAICGVPGQVASSSAVPSQSSQLVGNPPAAPSSQTLPPGPGGNS